MRAFWVLALLLTPAALLAEEPADATPPSQAVLTVVSDTQWKLTRQAVVVECVPVEFTYTVELPVFQTVEEIIDGKAVQRTVEKRVTETRVTTRMKPVCKTITDITLIDPRLTEAFDVAGNPLTAEEVAKRCAKDTLVVLMRDGQMLSPAYAKLFKDDAIVVAMPSRVLGLPRNDPPQPAKVPQGPPPTFIHVSMADEARLALRRTVPAVETSVAQTFSDDPDDSAGKLLPVQETTTRSIVASVPWEAVRISAAGTQQEVDAEKAKAALAKAEYLMAMSADGRAVDPFWLQNFKPSVPVLRGILLSPPAPPQAPVPAPVPSPVPTPVPVAPGAPPAP